MRIGRVRTSSSQKPGSCPSCHRTEMAMCRETRMNSSTKRGKLHLLVVESRGTWRDRATSIPLLPLTLRSVKAHHAIPTLQSRSPHTPQCSRTMSTTRMMICTMTRYISTILRVMPNSGNSSTMLRTLTWVPSMSWWNSGSRFGPSARNRESL